MTCETSSVRRHLLILVAVCIGARAAALWLSGALPLFTADSHSYLHTAKAWWISPIRPAATGLFYRLALLARDDIRTLVVAQCALGVGTATAVYFLARELEIPSLAALIIALLTSLAPSTLLFERAMHSEALAAFVTAAFYVLLLRGVRSDRLLDWAGVGLAAAAAALTRNVLGWLIPATLLILMWGVRTRRLSMRSIFAFLPASMTPLLGYLIVAYCAFGTLGITHFDGVSLFAVVADGTDCSDPSRPPPIRSSLCAEPSLLDADPGAILWGDGPVQDAIASRGWPTVNAELRVLAREAIVRHPLAFAAGVARRLKESIYGEDPPYVGNPSTTPLPYNVARDFPQNLADFPTTPEPLWNEALSIWYRVRRPVWVGLLASSLLCWGWPAALRSRPMQCVAIVTLPTLLGTILFSYASPRLLYPLEMPAMLASAWLAARTFDRLRSWAADRRREAV